MPCLMVWRSSVIRHRLFESYYLFIIVNKFFFALTATSARHWMLLLPLLIHILFNRPPIYKTTCQLEIWQRKYGNRALSSGWRASNSFSATRASIPHSMLISRRGPVQPLTHFTKISTRIIALWYFWPIWSIRVLRIPMPPVSRITYKRIRPHFLLMFGLVPGIRYSSRTVA